MFERRVRASGPVSGLNTKGLVLCFIPDSVGSHCRLGRRGDLTPRPLLPLDGFP